MRRILLGLIVATLLTSPALAAPDRLPTGIRPTRMEVALDLDPARADYSGTVTATLQATEPTSVIRLHGRALTVTHATIASAGSAPRPAKAERISSDQWTITP